MTYPPPVGPDPDHRNPHDRPVRTGLSEPYREREAPHMGYRYPPGPEGFGPSPTKRSRAGLVVIVAVLLLGLSVGGFFGVRALTGAEDTNSLSAEEGSRAAEGSGEIFSPSNKLYSVEIPNGVVKVPLREDESIPSETDLSLELEGKVHAGGLIKTGTLSGPAAKGTFDAVAEEAAQKYSGQYEGNPDQWGTGAEVGKKEMKVGGRDAIEVTARFSPSGEPEPSIFFRVYFVDPPSGSPILITCDWNTDDTEDIEGACDSLVASFKVKK